MLLCAPCGEAFIAKNRTARALLHGPPGGLFGIDPEVVTLRGLYGNSGYQIDSGATDAGIESKLTG